MVQGLTLWLRHIAVATTLGLGVSDTMVKSRRGGYNSWLVQGSDTMVKSRRGGYNSWLVQGSDNMVKTRRGGYNSWYRALTLWLSHVAMATTLGSGA